MAAKVVMVAVPAVLGIASIREHGVEVTMEGLLSPEQLSIYTPVPRLHQLQFIEEQPGALQSRLGAMRGGLQPYAQAMQGACVSVKLGTINLYHAGEDVYHYLKDPPPGFLPRVGSITMAGLVGMLLARKGSRVRRLAVPLALVTAGTSVCYPAQTVSVLKVTGKELYAVGQWTSSAFSSLLTPSPKAAKNLSTPSTKPQSSAVPKPESPVKEDHPVPEPPSSPPSPAQAVPLPCRETVVVYVPDVPTPEPPTPDAVEELPASPAQTPAESSRTQPEVDKVTEGSGFSPDPVLMDYGQSDPEDADLYSTRS